MQVLVKSIERHVEVSGWRKHEGDTIDIHSEDSSWKNAQWEMILKKISEWTNHTIPTAVLFKELTTEDEGFASNLKDIIKAIR